jgi:hypothetical protein
MLTAAGFFRESQLSPPFSTMNSREHSISELPTHSAIAPAMPPWGRTGPFAGFVHTIYYQGHTRQPFDRL